MFFDKKKKKAVMISAPTTEAAYQAGLHGAGADMYAIHTAALTYAQEKKSAYLLYSKKSNSGMSLTHSLAKHFQLRDEDRRAQNMLFEIHQCINKGAVEAFLDGRPENLQEILAHPQDFPESASATQNGLTSSTLIKILAQTPDAGIPLLALEKTDAKNRQGILNNTLYALVNDYTDIEQSAIALLDAGANASCSSSIILAAAIHKRQPGAVIDLLLEHGANYQAALERMHQHAEYYGENAVKIVYDKYRNEADARIRAQQERIKELEETVAELTRRTGKEPAPQSEPQTPAGPQTHAAAFVKKFPHL